MNSSAEKILKTVLVLCHRQQQQQRRRLISTTALLHKYSDSKPLISTKYEHASVLGEKRKGKDVHKKLFKVKIFLERDHKHYR